MNPKIGLVILNWNNWSETVACLRELQNISYPKECLQIIVVENGSDDNSLEQLRDLNDITLIPLDFNHGFSGGNNVGILCALETNCDFILLLNNDIHIEPHFLNYLLEAFEIEQNIGLVSPKIYYDAPPNTIWYAGGQFLQPRILGKMIGMRELDIGQYDEQKRVDFAVGACMLIRRSVFEKIGYLDSSLFFYHEDIDFSYRAVEAGFSIWYQPFSKLIHKVSSSTRDNLPYRTYLEAQARTIFLLKHIHGFKIPLVIILEIGRLLRVISRNLWHCRPSIAYNYIKGISQGITDWFNFRSKPRQR